MQGKLAEGRAPHGRGVKEVCTGVGVGGAVCVAQQDMWAPEFPGELMREAPAKLSIGGDFCIGRRWVGGSYLE